MDTTCIPVWNREMNRQLEKWSVTTHRLRGAPCWGNNTGLLRDR